MSATTTGHKSKSWDRERRRLQRHRDGQAVRHPSFVEHEALKTGVSPRTIRRRISIVENIDPSVKSLIRQHHLAHTQADLLNLSRLPVEEQVYVVNRLIQGDAKTVTEAIAGPATEQEKRLERIGNLLTKALREAEQLLAADTLSVELDDIRDGVKYVANLVLKTADKMTAGTRQGVQK